MASIRINAPITAAWSRANARAVANAKAGRRAERIGCRTYRVASAHSARAYTVKVNSVVNLDAECDCPHGQGGTAGVCWHKSAAIAAAINHIVQCQGERATAPKPAPEPLPPELAAIVDDGTPPAGPKPERTPALAPERAAEVNRLMARFSRT